MPSSASRLLELSDRRDQLALSMVIDAARVKKKLGEAKRKQARQVGYRGVRYQRFKGRRGEAMEDEMRQEIRARRTRSIQVMAEWLEAQAISNALEGTPRDEIDEAVGFAPGALSPEKPSVKVASTPAAVASGQRLITFYLAEKSSSTVAAAPIVAASGQRLITSFLAQSRR